MAALQLDNQKHQPVVQFFMCSHSGGLDKIWNS
uniref:Uncharacterized protein n=1 Tax=Arundo donax TaxID=35708 RepID=A0A0A8Z7S0_ARUDO